MPEGVAIDTDVLLKVSAYRISDELLTLLEPFGPAGALGLTHIIAPSQLARMKRLIDKDGALAELRHLLATLCRIEPSDEEIGVAAALEEAALTSALPLD